jgi:hypothetical protein
LRRLQTTSAYALAIANNDAPHRQLLTGFVAEIIGRRLT